MSLTKGAEMNISKAKEVVAFVEKQFILENNGRFQGIKFTTYAVAKKVLQNHETN